MRLRWAGLMVIAVGVSMLSPLHAHACIVQTPYDIGAAVERSDTVIKARIAAVEPGEVLPKNRWILDEAHVLTLQTVYTFKGKRRSTWRVGMRMVPTYGLGDIENWRRRIGKTKIIALDPPFHPPRPVGPVASWSHVGGDPHEVWGSVPDGEGGALYEIVGLPCAGRVIIEPGLLTELRIAAVAQRELLIFLFAIPLAWFIARIVRRRKLSA